MIQNKQDALKRFDELYRSPTLLIHDITETGVNVRYPYRPHAWAVRFSFDFAWMIRPSRLVCFSKSDGEVVYDGTANDEG